MATKRMLIDASHPEETRVVVVDGTRVEDYDVEVASRRQLKGNIYLAKITRVEPSLQAAFVDYGGNRHGFLAFSEIHPDYYRIPISDREPEEADGHIGNGDSSPENGDEEAGVPLAAALPEPVPVTDSAGDEDDLANDDDDRTVEPEDRTNRAADDAIPPAATGLESGQPETSFFETAWRRESAAEPVEFGDSDALGIAPDSNSTEPR